MRKALSSGNSDPPGTEKRQAGAGSSGVQDRPKRRGMAETVLMKSKPQMAFTYTLPLLTKVSLVIFIKQSLHKITLPVPIPPY